MKFTQVANLDIALDTVSWAFIAAATWLVVGGLVWAEPLPQPEVRRAVSPRSAGNPTRTEISLEQLAPLWSRDLRQTLIEPEPEPLPAPPPPPAAAPVRLPKLLATFVERGQSWGLFVDAGGALRVRTAFGKLDDFLIVEITPGVATLQRGQREFEIRVRRAQERAAPRRRGRAPW